MNRKDLPTRWTDKLRSYLAEQGPARDHLLTSDFKTGISLRFEDGSSVCFKYAFCLQDAERNEIAVFTEHCGYHIFPLVGTEIELLEPEEADDGRWFTEMFRLMDEIKASSDGERWSRSELYRY